MSEQPLKPLIDKLLRAYGYQDQLDEMDLVAAYEELVGKMYCKHTKSINFKNKILYVKIFPYATNIHECPAIAGHPCVH